MDDKSYMARNHAGLVQLFVWAEKYNGFTGTEMKPPKGGVQSLVPRGKGYAAAKDLPDLVVHLAILQSAHRDVHPAAALTLK